MVEGQKLRFENNKSLELIQNYLADPDKYQNEYYQLLEKESVAQYQDYFKSENDEFDNVVFQLNKKKFLLAFENWQLERKDRSTYQTFPLPEWNTDLGFWANALEVVKEVQKVGSKLDEIEIKSTSDSLSTTSIQEKK
jgi:hypothetical protein